MSTREMTEDLDEMTEELDDPVPCSLSTDYSDFKKSTTIAGTRYQMKYTESPADPQMTSGLEDHYGDVHLNTSTQQYWVFSDTWEMKSEYQDYTGQIVKVAFVHPACKVNTSAGKFIWDTRHTKWTKAENVHIGRRLPGEVEGRAKRRRNVQSEDLGGPALKKHASTNVVGTSQLTQAVLDHPQWKEIWDLWRSQTPMHDHAWIECTDWLQNLSAYKLLVPGEGSLLVRLTDPTTSQPFTDEHFWNEFRLCREKESEISNRGTVEQWSVARFWSVWGERQCATDPKAPYLAISKLSPMLVHGGLNDIRLEWGPETSSSSSMSPPTHPVLDDPENLSATFTPPGYITRPHADGFGHWLRVVHWKGTKIWLVWPGTLHNLSHLKCDITTRKNLDTRLSYYIKNLQGMEIYVIQTNHGRPIAFKLPPSTIHACISIDTSSHSSLAIWGKEGLKEAQICNQFMMNCWTEVWEKHRKKLTGWSTTGNEVQERLQALINETEENWDKQAAAHFWDWKKEWMVREEKGWNLLVNSFKTQGEGKEIRDWVKEVMDFIEENITDSHYCTIPIGRTSMRHRRL